MRRHGFTLVELMVVIVIIGLLSAATNPKGILFFAAFLPQFIAAESASPVRDMLVLSAVFMAMTFAVFASSMTASTPVPSKLSIICRAKA